VLHACRASSEPRCPLSPPRTPCSRPPRAPSPGYLPLDLALRPRPLRPAAPDRRRRRRRRRRCAHRHPLSNAIAHHPVGPHPLSRRVVAEVVAALGLGDEGEELGGNAAADRAAGAVHRVGAVLLKAVAADEGAQVNRQPRRGRHAHRRRRRRRVGRRHGRRARRRHRRRRGAGRHLPQRGGPADLGRRVARLRGRSVHGVCGCSAGGGAPPPPVGRPAPHPHRPVGARRPDHGADEEHRHVEVRVLRGGEAARAPRAVADVEEALDRRPQGLRVGVVGVPRRRQAIAGGPRGNAIVVVTHIVVRRPRGADVRAGRGVEAVRARCVWGRGGAANGCGGGGSSGGGAGSAHGRGNGRCCDRDRDRGRCRHRHGGGHAPAPAPPHGANRHGGSRASHDEALPMRRGRALDGGGAHGRPPRVTSRHPHTDTRTGARAAGTRRRPPPACLVRATRVPRRGAPRAAAARRPSRAPPHASPPARRRRRRRRPCRVADPDGSRVPPPPGACGGRRGGRARRRPARAWMRRPSRWRPRFRLHGSPPNARTHPHGEWPTRGRRGHSCRLPRGVTGVGARTGRMMSSATGGADGAPARHAAGAADWGRRRPGGGTPRREPPARRVGAPADGAAAPAAAAPVARGGGGSRGGAAPVWLAAHATADASRARSAPPPPLPPPPTWRACPTVPYRRRWR
ncbi:hypothetical protein BU14_2197s0001, partial [Porphyra umbilicalis]